MTDLEVRKQIILHKIRLAEIERPRGLGYIPALTLIVLGLFGIMIAFSGCSLPCTYQGKAVPRADAERMKSMGMDVVCP